MSDTSGFRTAWRGYEPAQVDQAVQQLRSALGAALDEVEQLRRRVRELEASTAEPGERAAPATSSTDPAPPAFEQLGGRVTEVLRLAEQVAAERVATAETEAARMLDAAEQQAAARRAEADASHEQQRRLAAEAAADFEAQGAAKPEPAPPVDVRDGARAEFVRSPS